MNISMTDTSSIKIGKVETTEKGTTWRDITIKAGNEELVITCFCRRGDTDAIKVTI